MIYKHYRSRIFTGEYKTDAWGYRSAVYKDCRRCDEELTQNDWVAGSCGVRYLEKYFAPLCEQYFPGIMITDTKALDTYVLKEHQQRHVIQTKNGPLTIITDTRPCGQRSAGENFENIVEEEQLHFKDENE